MNQFSIDLEKVGMLGGVRSTFPGLVNIATVLPLPFFRDAAEGGKRMIRYANDAIQRCRVLVTEDPEKHKPTLFSTIVFNKDLPDADIMGEAVGYIVAGSDTTANTLTYLVWAVCRDDRIRKALLHDLASLPENFNDEDACQLPYLDQLINETLRVYSAAPSALPRIVPPGGAQMGDYGVPGGLTVSTQAYSLHRDPDAFPEPER